MKPSAARSPAGKPPDMRALATFLRFRPVDVAACAATVFVFLVIGVITP